jgi:hypothetical protein
MMSESDNIIPMVSEDNVEVAVSSVSDNVINDVSNNPIDIVKTFTELLTLTINSQELQDKISVKLDSNTIKVINSIIKFSPDYFNDIEKLVGEIVKDNKIDSSDIPAIISLIGKLYNLLCKLNTIKNNKQLRADLCSSIIKFVIHLLVKEGKIKIDDDKKEEFLKVCDSLIDSCISIIKMPSLIKPKNLFNICFKK